MNTTPTDQTAAPTSDDRRRELLEMLDQLSPTEQAEIAALCTALLDSQAGRMAARDTEGLRAALARSRAANNTRPIDRWLRGHGYLTPAVSQ